MRKKITLLMVILMFLFTFTIIKVNAQDEILGETLVYKYSRIDDLPTQFVKGSELQTYEYEDEWIPDFRHYFEVYDNAETILNMHAVGGIIDHGKYVWEMDFDIDVVGEYEITLSYDGVTGLKSETITLEVIPEDVEGPEIFISGGNFNKTRTENPSEFLSEFNTYLRRARVYDKVDGVIKITIDDFIEEEIDLLRTANLNDLITLTLNVKDKAGNVSNKAVTLKIVDLKAPNIHNATTIMTKKGQRVNLTSHLSFSDNYSDESYIRENARYEIYSTLVVKNVWEVGPRRLKPSEGKERNNYLKLTNSGLDSFVDYLNDTYPTVYVVGDYYEINHNEGQKSYVYISKKVEIEDSEVEGNIWEITSDKIKATGRRLAKYETFNYSQEELLEYVSIEHEEGFKVHDYYQVLDLMVGNKYFVYIKETENVYRDKHEQPIIDFNKVGVYYIRVEAEDEAGNVASAVYRVVVADGLSLMEGVLIINGIVLMISLVVVVVFIVFRRRQ